MVLGEGTIRGPRYTGGSREHLTDNQEGHSVDRKEGRNLNMEAVVVGILVAGVWLAVERPEGQGRDETCSVLLISKIHMRIVFKQQTMSDNAAQG